MDKHTTDFDDIEDAAADKRRLQNFDDLQNEMAGNEVGRISRFLTGDGHGAKAAEKRRAKWNATLTNLQIMMNDREYAQLYRDTETKLRETQSNLDAALDRVQQMKAGAEAALSEALEHAAHLPDGRRVFKDQIGRVLFENGDLVEDDWAAMIVWNGSEPGYEEMRAQKDRLGSLSELETDIYIGQAEIGDMQERMVDEGNPPSAETLLDFQDQAFDMVSGFEAELRGMANNETHKETGLTQADTPLPEFNVPEL